MIAPFIRFVNNTLSFHLDPKPKVNTDLPHTTTVVESLPKCDVCDARAEYDARSVHGPWGFFCAKHFLTHTPGKLGLGVGQKLIARARKEGQR